MHAPRASRSSKCSAPDRRHAADVHTTAAVEGRELMKNEVHFLFLALHPSAVSASFPRHLDPVLTHARIQAPPSSFRIQRSSGSYKPTGDEEEFFRHLFERTSFFSKSGRSCDCLYSREKEGPSYLVGSTAQLNYCCKCSCW